MEEMEKSLEVQSFDPAPISTLFAANLLSRYGNSLASDGDCFSIPILVSTFLFNSPCSDRLERMGRYPLLRQRGEEGKLRAIMVRSYDARTSQGHRARLENVRASVYKACGLP